MNQQTKTLTIDGKRYRVATRSYDDCLSLHGHDVNVCLPEGTTIDSSNLREVVIAAISRDRANREAATKYIQESLRKQESRS